MGIPAMGHVGLTPQSIHQIGGYKVQGRTPETAEKILSDAKAVERAGAFAVVLEAMPSDLAAKITDELRIPTIGIGAGPHCDGQVLVTNLRDSVLSAAKTYKKEVEEGKFPTEEYSY